MRADVYLPEDHSDRDLELAAEVALTLRMKTLVVFWSLRGRYF